MSESDGSTATDQIQIERVLEDHRSDECNILSIVRGEFGDRQVEWKLRNNDGTFEYACEYYHHEELLYEGDWLSFEFVGLNEAGDTVQTPQIHGGDKMPLEDWIDSAAEVHLEDQLTEVWDDVHAQYGSTDS